MPIEPNLIDRIYEAAASPNLWPSVLQAAAERVGAFGMCFVHRSTTAAGWVTSEGMDELAAAYVADGWLVRDERVPPVIAEQYPGFRVDADYWSEKQVSEMPVYREFLLPRGHKASAACALQGARDDALHIGVEGLPSYAKASEAVPLLNVMRPHLARAISLSVKLSQVRVDASVAALQLAGVGAAVISPDGRLRSANDRFVTRLGSRIDVRSGAFRFTKGALQKRFSDLIQLNGRTSKAMSFGVRSTFDEPAIAIHLVPLGRGSRDVFGWDGVLLMLAEPANNNVPGADLLRLLFDLTPAEARLTRHLLEGRTPAEAATLLRITEATVRVHLRRVFAKTGVTRQAELVRLLTGLGAPDAEW